jgi:hypothetical protein
MKKKLFTRYFVFIMVSSFIIGSSQFGFAADNQQGLTGTVTLIDGNGNKHIDKTMVLTLSSGSSTPTSQFIGTIFIDDPNLPAPFNFDPPIPQQITGIFDGQMIIITAFQTYIQGKVGVDDSMITINGYMQLTNNSPVNTATGTFSLSFKYK